MQAKRYGGPKKKTFSFPPLLGNIPVLFSRLWGMKAGKWFSPLDRKRVSVYGRRGEKVLQYNTFFNLSLSFTGNTYVGAPLPLFFPKLQQWQQFIRDNKWSLSQPRRSLACFFLNATPFFPSDEKTKKRETVKVETSASDAGTRFPPFKCKCKEFFVIDHFTFVGMQARRYRGRKRKLSFPSPR